MCFAVSSYLFAPILSKLMEDTYDVGTEAVLDTNRHVTKGRTILAIAVWEVPSVQA